MEKLTHSNLVDALMRVSISTGDKLLVHSSIMAFGLPESGTNTFISALKDIVGPKGVIAAPTFTFKFITDGYYSFSSTESVAMGALNEALREQEGSVRSNHPIQSVIFLGNVSKNLVKNRPFSAYEEGGTFDIMVEEDYKILLLGVPPEYISHSHLSEEKYQVPYRYMKKINGTALFEGAQNPINGVWGFYARNLEMDARPEKEDIIIDELLAKDKWHQTLLNGSEVSCGYAHDFVRSLNKKLELDPNWMLKTQDFK